MACNSGLPPRRLSRDVAKMSRSLPGTTLGLLIDMGFSKQLSEKVVAAVGDKDIHVAVDWLMSHLEDPMLKETTPREYVVYLCPVGALNKSLMDYWEQSESKCGWNGVHSHFPHITLCPFFKVPDDKMSQLIEAFSSLHNVLMKSPGELHLERYSAPNFIGLFVPEQHHSYFEGAMREFAEKLLRLGVKLEPHKKQLHLTLAYQFQKEQYDTLNTLSNAIDTGLSVRWDLRLYSRDHRLADSQVYRMVQNFTATSDDEIDLVEGDYMCVDNSIAADHGDGWMYGTSWLTGCSGVFPDTFCKRTAEMGTWTLHKSLSLDTDSIEATTFKDSCETDIAALYSKIKRRRSAPALPPRKNRGPRRLYVMRHGERIDFVMGRDWAVNCFDGSGNYSRMDLNMPHQLPRRRDNSQYFCDSPLTEVGLFQARGTGEALAHSGVTISHVYSSPSFRCVQTASAVITGIGADLTINIEPALFEWLQWYQAGLPMWLSEEELVAHGHRINRSYTPFYSLAKLDTCHAETVEQYYQRNQDFCNAILATHNYGENILVVGHAASVDVCMRQARGFQPRSPKDFQEFVSKVPYCALATYEENVATKRWTLKESPIHSLTHSSNWRHNWSAEFNI